MCGIFGLVGPYPITQITKIAASGAEYLRRRGPDGYGLFADNGIALSHRRLAIFDLSERGKQPFQYLHYVLVFNGAIYNYLELRSQLMRKGYSFSSQTDTEVIVAAYDCWRENCVHRFNGMWAFTIYDRRKQLLFCSRDRFGIRPFYYLSKKDHFSFASEIKSFRSLPFWQGGINEDRAFEFLAYGWQQHTNDTMWKDIKQLPPGCNAFYYLNNHQFEIKPYYNLSTLKPRSVPELFEERKHIFHELLSDSVRLRLRGNVPIALSLSGGMDSSSLAALSPVRLQAFSTIFPNTPFDESYYAKTMAEHLGWSINMQTPSFEDLFELLEENCYQVDEPLNSMSVIAHYHLLKQIQSSGYKIVISGQGADEILGGYDKFYRPFLRSMFSRHPSTAATESLAFLRYNYDRLPNVWRKYKKWKQRSNGSIFMHPNPSSYNPFIRLEDSNMASTTLNLMTNIGLPERLLYEDRNSLAHGVESRVPFLDHRIVEYSLALPDRDKIRHGQRKYILRESMKGTLPRTILRRYKKLGYPTPQTYWIEHHSKVLLDYLDDHLLFIESFTDENSVEKLANILKNKQRAKYPIIWRAVSFVSWYNQTF